jgi:hypothetical protein
MTRRYRRRHDDADHDTILRDGERLRFPLTLMDSLHPVQQAVAQSSVRVTDGQGGTANLNRPGFRLPVTYDAAMSARDKAYLDYDREIARAYLNPGLGGDPAITGSGSHGPVGAREGDYCTKDGCPGRLVRGADGKLFCQIEPEDCGLSGYEQSAEAIVRNSSTHTHSAHRRADHRSVEQVVKDHQTNMDAIYHDYDTTLAQSYRTK